MFDSGRSRAGAFLKYRGSWRYSFLAIIAALAISVMALPGTAQAGLLGGGTSPYIISEPGGTSSAVLNAVASVGGLAD